MKKILLAAGTILIPFMATFAQDYNRDYANEADPAIKSQFSADYPDAQNVHFARTKGLNAVSFTQDKNIMTAYYDNRDQLIGTILKQSIADLPENAQNEIRNKYPGYSIANVVKFDDNQSDDTEMILYGVSWDDADNYFVELKNDSKTIVVKVDLTGGVEAFGPGLTSASL
jgi:hypothetical protein